METIPKILLITPNRRTFSPRSQSEHAIQFVSGKILSPDQGYPTSILPRFFLLFALSLSLSRMNERWINKRVYSPNTVLIPNHFLRRKVAPFPFPLLRFARRARFERGKRLKNSYLRKQDPRNPREKPGHRARSYLRRDTGKERRRGVCDEGALKGRRREEVGLKRPPKSRNSSVPLAGSRGGPRLERYESPPREINIQLRRSPVCFMCTTRRTCTPGVYDI